MSPSLCAAVLLLVAGQSPVALEGSVGAGGGYEDNVTLAPADAPRTGSPVYGAWAGLGVGWEPGKGTYLSLGARYDRSIYDRAGDLNRHTAAGDLLLVQELSDTVAVILAGGGAWNWYQDPARSGPGVSGRAMLRVRALPWLTLRGGYGYRQRWADDDVYGSYAHRIIGSAEARIARGVYLGVTYAWQSVDQTFYATSTSPATALSAATLNADPGPGGAPGGSTEPGAGAGGIAAPGAGTGSGTAPGAGGGTVDAGTGATAATGSGSGAGAGAAAGAGPGAGGMPGASSSGVFETLVPYRARATDSTITPSVDVAIWDGIYVFASYSFTWGSSVEGRYYAHAFFGGAGYRF